MINKINKNTLITLFFISSMYLLPIILANVYYIDDMGRIKDGYGWDRDGRFIASYFSELLSFNQWTTSFFPYSQLIAGFITAISGLIICDILDLRSNKNYLLISLLFLTSPFYLENLAYRYDSIYMALSIFFAVMPFLFWKSRRFIPIGVLSVFLIFGLYQTTAMMFVACMFLMQIYFVLTQQKIEWKLAVYTIISFIAAYFFYKVFLAILNIDLVRDVLLPFEYNSLMIIKQRLLAYYEIFETLLINSNYIYAFFPLLFLAILGFIQTLSSGKSINKIFLSFSSIIICAIGIFFCILLPNLFLQEMWFSARTFITYPVVLFTFVIFAVQLKSYNSRLINNVTSLALAALVMYGFVLSSIFGSILKNNEEYHLFLATNISRTVLENAEDENIGLVITGQAEYAPKSMALYANYPIMKFLIPNYLSEGWVWGRISQSPFYVFTWPENKIDLEKNVMTQRIAAHDIVYVIIQESL